MLELMAGFLQIQLGLLELSDVGSGDVIPIHLDRGFDFRIDIDHLGFQPFLILSQQFLGRHDLRHGIVEVGNAVPHVPDRLLQDEFRILSPLDNAAEQRAQ